MHLSLFKIVCGKELAKPPACLAFAGQQVAGCA
jgi:hypothetical protein